MNIGQGISAEKPKLDLMLQVAAGSGSKFARSMLLHLFKRDELQDCSISGRPSNFHKGDPKPQLDPIRMGAIIGIFNIV